MSARARVFLAASSDRALAWSDRTQREAIRAAPGRSRTRRASVRSCACNSPCDLRRHVRAATRKRARAALLVASAARASRPLLGRVHTESGPRAAARLSAEPRDALELERARMTAGIAPRNAVAARARAGARGRLRRRPPTAPCRTGSGKPPRRGAARVPGRRPNPTWGTARCSRAPRLPAPTPAPRGGRQYGLGSRVVLGSILRGTVTDDDDPAVTPPRRT
jgi:hypothetical protein